MLQQGSTCTDNESLPMFRGSIPALVTPFDQGAVDEPVLRTLVDWQIASGTAALVACGTTGESSTLCDAEWEQVIGACVEQSGGAVPVDLPPF
jgi:4-hydroxy-tetrahydrodipicolinate synthase